MAKQKPKPASTTDQLRIDIDRGRTGDKVAWPDPAAAPLGADEEAAGNPVPPRLVALSHRGEGGARPRQHRRGTRIGTAWVLIVFVLALIGSIVGWIFASI
jgi:hypothetical protein